MRWQENREEAEEVVKRFEFLDQIEMTKVPFLVYLQLRSLTCCILPQFLYPILEALFNMVLSTDSKQTSLTYPFLRLLLFFLAYSIHIRFSAIVHLVCCLLDDRG